MYLPTPCAFLVPTEARRGKSDSLGTGASLRVDAATGSPVFWKSWLQPPSALFLRQVSSLNLELTFRLEWLLSEPPSSCLHLFTGITDLHDHVQPFCGHRGLNPTSLLSLSHSSASVILLTWQPRQLMVFKWIGGICILFNHCSYCLILSEI